jgi:hypothetical protein
MLPDSYPIRGLGFSAFVLAFGLVQSNINAFPFVWLQLIFGLLVLGVLVRVQLLENHIGRMWLAYGFLFLAVGFFSRVFNDNHLGYAVTVLLIGGLWDAEKLNDA